MDRRMSTLNPYASSYIPLSKRGKEDQIRSFQITPGLPFSDDKIALSRPAESHESWTAKGLPTHALHDSQSQKLVMQKQNLDEETEMDLAYLATAFPGVSDRSLADVYYANGGDIEASIDMLSELEFPADFSQHLPDTLDIGDVAEFGSSAEGKTVIAKVISGEASGSSSGVSKYVQ